MLDTGTQDAGKQDAGTQDAGKRGQGTQDAAERQKNPARWALLGIAAGAIIAISPALRWMPSAEAQVGSPGKQRIEQIQVAKKTNELLTEIRDLLKEQAAAKRDGQ